MNELTVIYKGRSFVPISTIISEHCKMCDGRGTGLCKYVNCRAFDSVSNWKEIGWKDGEKDEK